VTEQTIGYGNWQLCHIPGSGLGNDEMNPSGTKLMKDGEKTAFYHQTDRRQPSKIIDADVEGGEQLCLSAH
jgi:hypothetical protein